MSEGSLGCDTSSKMLVSGYTHLPVLEGYSPSGTQKWTTRMRDVHPLQREEKRSDSGSFVLSNVTDGRNAYTGIWKIEDAPGDAVVVQVRKMTKQSSKAGQPYAAIETYLISSTTGDGVYVGDEIGPILDVTRDRVLVGTNTPFPQIKVWSF